MIRKSSAFDASEKARSALRAAARSLVARSASAAADAASRANSGVPRAPLLPACNSATLLAACDDARPPFSSSMRLCSATSCSSTSMARPRGWAAGPTGVCRPAGRLLSAVEGITPPCSGTLLPAAAAGLFSALAGFLSCRSPSKSNTLPLSCRPLSMWPAGRCVSGGSLDTGLRRFVKFLRGRTLQSPHACQRGLNKTVWGRLCKA